MVQDRAMWNNNSNSYAIYRMVPFSVIFNDLVSRIRHYTTLNISETVQDRDTECPSSCIFGVP